MQSNIVELNLNELGAVTGGLRLQAGTYTNATLSAQQTTASQPVITTSTSTSTSIAAYQPTRTETTSLMSTLLRA